MKNEYECVICYEKITEKSPIWSCSVCYRVVDLKCVRNWAERETADQNMFKCPHCRVLQKRTSSYVYRCWCEKEVLKTRTDFGKAKSRSLSSIPHSCGQTCGRKRSCPHPCPLTCHPGPHLDSAECMHLGPVISCFCKKLSEQTVCSETRYQGFSCTSRCGIRNPVCGHKCSLVCHNALDCSKGHMKECCGPCNRQVQVTCRCGKVNGTKVSCASLTRIQRYGLKRKANVLITCDKVCGELLDCGVHKCSVICHSDDKHSCPLKPFEGEKCFCGKRLANRTSCSEPKVFCASLCGKQLDCGHMCRSVCHDSDCPPCCEMVEGVPCRCKRSTLHAVCGDLNVSGSLCDKKCGAFLICGRHHCHRLCCEFNPSTTASLKSKRRALLNHQSRLTAGPALGTSAISKKKRSRMRRLFENTSPVLTDEALSEKLAETNLKITKIDSLLDSANSAHSCFRLCDRLLSCGMHNCYLPCHTGPCPPCHSASFDERECPCGFTRVLPPIRCGAVMPPCTKPCHRPQPCGHQATHTCHADSLQCSPCTETVKKVCSCGKEKMKTHCCNTNVRCRNTCGQELRCGHQCTQRCCGESDDCSLCSHRCEKTFLGCNHKHLAVCHYPNPCPQDCPEQMLASCPCGCLTLSYDCGEAMEIGCNETCVKESYPIELLTAYDNEPDRLSRLEAKINQFVLNGHQKTIWFSPMSAYHRSLLHLLLRHYGMESESLDSGPLRSVRGLRTQRTRVPKFKLRNAPRSSPQLSIPKVIWQLNFAREAVDQEAWLVGLFANQQKIEGKKDQSSSKPENGSELGPIEDHQIPSKLSELEKILEKQSRNFALLALKDPSI